MANFEFDRNERFVNGQALRRRILGADYHDASTQQGEDDPFVGPLRQLNAEFVWNAIWGRPGLSEKTRRLINIAMLAAVNRQPELRTHVRAAYEVGDVTKDEIMEVLLHTTVYAGVPAGVDAFRTAKAYFDESETEDGKK
ncbi:MAG: carboxymuconolactone decarboxylase family protein [Gammaproteobacteria bacterium]|jgi:4-carboxymuconolactone decarboxylase